MSDSDVGICCFCGDGCNPNGQSCGRCARALTGFTLGWNPLPDHMKYLEKKTPPEDKDEPLKNRKRNRSDDSEDDEDDE